MRLNIGLSVSVLKDELTIYMLIITCPKENGKMNKSEFPLSFLNPPTLLNSMIKEHHCCCSNSLNDVPQMPQRSVSIVLLSHLVHIVIRFGTNTKMLFNNVENVKNNGVTLFCSFCQTNPDLMSCGCQ